VSEGGFFVRLRFIRVLATPVPLDARKKIIASRASEYQLDNTYWELENEWIEPEGPPFNVMYRSCQEAEKEVHRRLVQHVASLGYTTAYCFSLRQDKNLADPNNWLADLQRQTRGPYPDDLLQAILRKNRPVLGGGMQSCYFQQINAAIVRQDLVSLNHRVAAWLSSYFDILFAINGQFHPGEKRLLIYAEELANLPRNALLDVQQLCAFAGRLETPIAAHLERMLGRLDEKLTVIEPRYPLCTERSESSVLAACMKPASSSILGGIGSVAPPSAFARHCLIHIRVVGLRLIRILLRFLSIVRGT
jgi:hypothetical protein